MSNQKRAITLVHESDVSILSTKHKYQDVIDAVEQAAGSDLWVGMPVDDHKQAILVRSSLNGYFARCNRPVTQRYDKENKLLYIRIRDE
jgi:hypothetical protein